VASLRALAICQLAGCCLQANVGTGQYGVSARDGMLQAGLRPAQVENAMSSKTSGGIHERLGFNTVSATS